MDQYKSPAWKYPLIGLLIIFLLFLLFDFRTPKTSAAQTTRKTVTCLVSPEFPEKILRWCEYISYYATKRGLDPNLVAAVIWQESGGDPQAYSASGAVGLMQIMPSDGLAATFMCINGPCFSGRPPMDKLFDPEFNIKFGARMLADLIEREGGIREGLMAYGPMDQKGYYANKILSIYHQYGGQK